MTIEITHRRMSPATSRDHQHITDLKWKNIKTMKTGENTRQAMVKWIDDGGTALVRPGPAQSTVGTVDPKNGRPKYLRSHADGKYDNNLLSLPTF